MIRADFLRSLLAAFVGGFVGHWRATTEPIPGRSADLIVVDDPVGPESCWVRVGYTDGGETEWWSDGAVPLASVSVPYPDDATRRLVQSGRRVP
jgi:hypothetical protein